ncbi:MAG: right-handed parallel beta-helix repeat-containing protein [Phycisphaerae bacterium]|nr:right-handed parallel beta-helix repeat-containing protein [Phycisphaerae bacterium]
MKARMFWLAIAIALFTVPTSVQARQLFYFLVGDTIQTYDFDGVRQETFALSIPGGGTRRTAMTTDGSTAWFVYDPKDGPSWISGLAIRPGGGGRTINIDYSEYFFTGGLALGGDTVFLGRHRMPHASYSPWFRIDRYSASTGGFGGAWTAQTYPDRMACVDGQIAAVGSSTTVYVYTPSGHVDRSFNVGSLYPGHGPTGLAANNQTIWVFYYAVGNNNGHAFDWYGNRRADRDVVFQGLATPTDACLASAPDKAIILPEPASLNFGDLPEGGWKAMPLRIRNVGNLPLTISSVTLSDTTNYAYPGPASTTIPAGGHFDTSVTFKPQTTGSFAGSLTVASNDPDHASLVVALTGEGRAGVSYVDGDRPASGDGTSWDTAFKSIADALAAPGVLDNTEIWVRQGTYALSQTLAITKRIAIYGGFAGTETTRAERDWQNNTAIIDGGNMRQCVHITASNVILDGFTIEKGRNDAAFPGYYGGGILVEGLQTVIQNCTVRNCSATSGFGGGIAVTGVMGANSTIRNCRIVANTAAHRGGGIFNSATNTTISDCTVADNAAGSGGGIGTQTSTTIRNCRIVANRATVFAGGGIYNEWATGRMESCLIAGNTGEGVYNYVAAPLMINCTVVDNSANGIALLYAEETPSILNSIVWGNGGEQILIEMDAGPIVRYCVVGDPQYGIQPDANGNVRRAPSFVDPDGLDNDPATWQDNDYRLKPGSYGIDCADGSAAPELDLNGSPRHDDPGTDNLGAGTPDYADLGAHEFQGITPDVLYVNATATGTQDGTSWADAFTTVQQAVNASGAGKEIWIREGTYVLSAPIEITKALAIYGGFNGTEAIRDYRNTQKHVVTIDGNATAANCFIVKANATIDGLTITRGTGSGNGGGLYIDKATATIARCTFSDHETVFAGAAIYANSSTVSISDCMFLKNHAAQRGPAYTDWLSAVTMRNCLFAGNRCDLNGGAIYIQRPSAAADITNCTFVDNRAFSGGAIGLNEASANIRSCILWGNTANYEPHIATAISGTASVEYSCVQGGGFSLTNINADPLFAAPGVWNDNGTPADATDDTCTVGDYHLASEHGRWDPAAETWILDAQTSPCIDAGDPAGDWTGELWPNGRRTNIGWYGGTWQASKSGPIGPDLTRDGWVDDRDMEILALAWLSDDLTCDIYPPGGDGIIDLNDFAAFAATYSPEPKPIVINFETGAFDPAYTWETGGSPGWSVRNEDVGPDNYYHATSAAGLAPRYTSSWLTLTIDAGTLNTLRFNYCMVNPGNRVTGEFYIDDVKKADLTSKEWTQVQYTLTPGTHTFKWLAKNAFWTDVYESMRLDDITFFAATP